MTHVREGTPGLALLEVAIVTAAYIAFAHWTALRLSPAEAMPGFLSDAEAGVGAVFLAGALAQLLFVAVAALFIPAVRSAIAATTKGAPRSAWIIALAAAAIQCATVAAFFLPQPAAIVEPSARNALLSFLPAPDGWTQEVLFRGYILIRLSRAGLPVALQIALSALAFASIHLGYIGSDGLGVFWPLVGTATLGAILAWSVVEGRGSILPATVAHVAIILIVQPWLALAS